MARKKKVDMAVNSRLDQFEKRLFVLKINYEKYFSGLLDIEPVKERDELRRTLRNLQKDHITNTVQKHRRNMLRSRFGSFEMYWTRNLVMIERGTHPKMKFRAKLKDQRNKEFASGKASEHAKRARRSAEREDAAFSDVFDKYIDARRQCGQDTEVSFDAVRKVLQNQVRTIKSQYRCNAVKFRVTVEEGKAKVKAVPLR